MTNWNNRIVGHGMEAPDQLLAHPGNWRIHPKHQQDALKGVLDDVGWVQNILVNKTTGHVVDGHLRVALALRHDVPEVPVLYVELSEEEESLILATLDPLSALAVADAQKLDELLQGVQSDDAAIQAMLSELAEQSGLYQDDFGVDKNAKPNPRQLPIDVIFTVDELGSPEAFIANRAGLKIGVRSQQKNSKRPHTHVFMPERWNWAFNITFVDNNYFSYDHTQHLKVVECLRPKYCTVMDIMTEVQCQKDDIVYYPFDQILDWAEELRQYAENVIVIPKYDCLDQIPDYFMLGYSVPTSHGGTPLPPEAFKGRRVHLLGGSWKAQLAHMAVLGDDVVSVDNNQIGLIASKFGQYVDCEGNTFTVSDTLPFVNNVRTVAMAISFGAIGRKVFELYNGGISPPSDKQAVAVTSLKKQRTEQWMIAA